MPLTEIVSIVSDIVLGLAAAITAAAAVRSLGTWRNQVAGKASFDAARQLIRSTYTLRRAIFIFRLDCLFFVHTERQSQAPNDGVADATKDTLSWLWEDIGPQIDEFEAAVLEAEALWGASLKQSTRGLEQIVSELRSSSLIYPEIAAGLDGLNERARDRVTQTLVGQLDHSEDAVDTEVEEAVQRIEAFVQPYLATR